MPESDSTRLAASIAELEKLLRSGSALRNHPTYGKPWTDAENKANARLQKKHGRAAQDLANAGLLWSGRIVQRCLEAGFKAATDRIAGYFESRRLILKKLRKLRSMPHADETRDSRIERLKAEIARLEGARAAPDGDPEFSAALRVVSQTFEGVMSSVRRDAQTVADRRADDAKWMLSAAEDLVRTHRGKATARLHDEIAKRLERAKFELPSAMGATQPKSGDGETPSDPKAPTPADAAADDEIPARMKKTWAQYRAAADALGDPNPTDREAYDGLERAAKKDGEADALPDFGTWTRYLREYRRRTGQQKYNSRHGRTGRSVRRSSEI